MPWTCVRLLQNMEKGSLNELLTASGIVFETSEGGQEILV